MNGPQSLPLSASWGQAENSKSPSILLPCPLQKSSTLHKKGACIMKTTGIWLFATAVSLAWLTQFLNTRMIIWTWVSLGIYRGNKRGWFNSCTSLDNKRTLILCGSVALGQLTFLGSQFFFSKLEIIIVPTSKDCCYN